MTGVAEYAKGDDAGFRGLMDKITRDRGFQCASYKDKCLRRRIAVRMRARATASFEAYCDVLDSDPREYERLMRSLTVNVTKFFRNWDAYAAIRQTIIPALMDQAEPEIRVWSAGCASGEEPYSLAILMHAHEHATARFDSVSILATDIDTDCLDHAKRAVYAESALGETPIDLRERYFTEVSGLYSPVPEARRAVSFEQSDLLRFQPPIERVHLIVCRNVIIYFEREAQDALFAHFHERLAPGGFLVLGKVETLLGDARGLFSALNARERIFRKV